MYNFCSLWDSNYALKGLTLISSLMATCGDDFKLYAMALDDKSYKLLPDIPQVERMRLADVEDEELYGIRKQRTWQEYVWGLTPSLMNAVFVLHEPDDLTQIDADTFFFRRPTEFFEEVKGISVAAVPHRFKPGSTEEREKIVNGFYNVNFVYAKNNRDGRDFVRNWDSCCRVWCYNRNENGKFADQGFLTSLIPEYCGLNIQNLGINLAPWSQLQYSYRGDRDNFYVSNEFREDAVTAYHFHETTHDPHGNITRKTNWPLHPFVDKYVYGIYEDCLKISAQESKVG